MVKLNAAHARPLFYHLAATSPSQSQSSGLKHGSPTKKGTKNAEHSLVPPNW